MGGPRSVWEEKPLLIKTIGAECKLASASTSNDVVDMPVTAAELCGWPEEQQPIGQFTGANELWISAGSELGGASAIE